jgi:hypothetical protein
LLEHLNIRLQKGQWQGGLKAQRRGKPQ